MKPAFRDRMGTLHTWAGIVLGVLLFAVFWTGTLSVFDKEIDRWMMPATRLTWGADDPRPALDRDVRPLLDERAAKAPAWTIILPTERVPFLTLSYGTEESRKSSREQFDPKTMARLPPSQTLGASGFIYPFHHNLTLRNGDIGGWAVGIAAMGMLCLLVSGVVIHRKIFAEFFSLRLHRAFGRSNLDVHNVSGVVLLPFHVLITLSGLIVAFSIYYPTAHEALYGESPASGAAAAGAASSPARGTRSPAGRQETSERAFLREALGRERLGAAGRQAGVASLDGIVADAERQWGAGSVYLVRVNNPGDVRGNVVLRRAASATVTKDIDNLRYASATGQRIGGFEASPTVNVWNFIAGTHYIQFSHWPIRWLYFLGGLGGCLMIATGLLFWTQARRRRQRRHGHPGVTFMDAASVAGVGGILAATAALLVANQWLPRQETVWGIERERCEVWAFYGVWIACGAHAAARVAADRWLGHLKAWREQCGAVAVLCLLAVLSNAWVTGDHLGRTLSEGFWPVAGTDLSLLAGAILSGLAMWRMAAQVARSQGDAVSAQTPEVGAREPARG